MTLAYIKWKDACAEEANDTSPRPPKAQLAVVYSAGFLLDENDEAVQLGMEYGSDEVVPGRYRISIPRVQILEMHTVQVVKLKKKPPKKTNAKKSTTTELLQTVEVSPAS